MIVIPDSSIVVSSLFGQADAARASSVLEAGYTLVAPDLLALEVGSASWRLRRTGQIDDEEATAALATFKRLPLTFVRITDLYSAAHRIAVSLDHSIYDCTFLALAEVRNATVVTADKRLIAKLASSPFGRLAVSLADFTTRH